MTELKTISCCTANDLFEMDISDVPYDKEPALNNLRVLQSLGAQLPPELKFLLVKETARANSSVSQGVAVRLATMAASASEQVSFRIINYGGGGAKYQEYRPQYSATSNEIIGYTISEVKPGRNEKPDANFHKDPLLDARADLEKRLDAIGWNKSIVYAFVTGTKRQAWEEAKSAEEHAALEMDAETLFQGLAIPAINNSYFLPQTEEAALEYLAVQTMGKFEGLSVNASAGVGRSSAQLGFTGGEFTIKHGMSTEKKLWEVPEKIKELAAVIKTDLIKAGAPGEVCIALKSGFLLPEVAPEFQRVLQRLYASRVETVET